MLMCCYCYYKGGEYEWLCEVMYEFDFVIKMMVYCVVNGMIWICLLMMFYEMVEVDGW